MLGIRLIDANALEDELNRWLDENPVLYDYGDDGFDYGKISGVDFCIEKLQKVPTIDPENMRPNGKWVCEQYEVPYCSNCGNTPLLNGAEDYEFTKFCPHCGANMDVDQDARFTNDNEITNAANEFFEKEYQENERNLKHAIQIGDTAAVESLRKRQMFLMWLTERI